MANRGLWLFAAALLAAIAFLSLRSCRSDAPASAVAVPEASTQPVEDDAAAAQAHAQAVLEQRRLNAMNGAVDTLHRYLAVLSGHDRAAADAFWTGHRPPAETHEADLRELEGLQSLHIQNATPKALDANPVPAAMEIPVELRASIKNKPLQRYRGWYRVRSSNPEKGEWSITSASIQAAPP